VKTILSLRRLSPLALGAVLAAGAAAQTVPDQNLPENNLNIPANLQVYGKRDPNIRKATAIVNDAVITGTDVDHRMALIISANQLKLSPQELEALRVQVTSQLIDETLQIQEAKAADITVSAQEIDNGFTRIAGSFNRPVAEMRSYLRSIGSSERSLRRQIEAQIAWRRYLQRRVTFNVNIRCRGEGDPRPARRAKGLGRSPCEGNLSPRRAGAGNPDHQRSARADGRDQGGQQAQLRSRSPSNVRTRRRARWAAISAG